MKRIQTRFFGVFELCYLMIFSSIFLLSCQTKPTKMYESQELKSRLQAMGDIYNNQNIQQVIVDARPAFDFNLSKINGSINLRWEEFTQRDEELRGVFERDLYFHSRRLARYGINPETPVTIVGRGLQGGGEEGRLAWTLKYMGIKNVRFLHIDAFDRSPSVKEAPKIQSVARGRLARVLKLKEMKVIQSELKNIPPPSPGGVDNLPTPPRSARSR